MQDRHRVRAAKDHGKGVERPAGAVVVRRDPGPDLGIVVGLEPTERVGHPVPVDLVDDLVAATTLSRRFHEAVVQLCGNRSLIVLAGAVGTFFVLALAVPAFYPSFDEQKYLGVGYILGPRVGGIMVSGSILTYIVLIPLLSLLVYNVLLAVTHVPTIVDAMMPTQWGSAIVDLAWLVGGIALWWPALCPDPARRLAPPLRMGYLFASTLAPTIPAALLMFGDYPYYGIYELAPRALGLSAQQDQQLAGLIMKVIGDPLIWFSTAFIFFRWQARLEREQEEA